jgi:hypothetical protein
MKHIKRFKKFEAISGTELVGPVGPAYGETGIQNKTISKNDTSVLYSDVDNKFYTQDEFYELYNEYLKLGGIPFKGQAYPSFDLINLNKLIRFINGSNNFNI